MTMMKRAFLVFAGFIILGLEAGNHEENSSGCDALNPALGKTTVSIKHEGKNRSYRLYVPKNYKSDISKYGLYLTIYYFYFHRIIRHWIDNDMLYQSGMFLIFTIFIIFFVKHIKKIV